VDDESALTAAVLHDTIEDTTTDFDDIEHQFGSEIAEWVKLLTKDKRRREPNREKEYIKGLARAPWQVKVCKLADVHDNLLDSDHFPSDRRAKTFRRSREYLSVLDDGHDKVRRAYQIVQRLLRDLDPQTA
jgi:(p)ppGpp synthase/HD superfamily hydrolase